jgi:hypothetical protein
MILTELARSNPANPKAIKAHRGRSGVGGMGVEMISKRFSSLRRED